MKRLMGVDGLGMMRRPRWMRAATLVVRQLQSFTFSGEARAKTTIYKNGEHVRGNSEGEEEEMNEEK